MSIAVSCLAQLCCPSRSLCISFQYSARAHPWIWIADGIQHASSWDCHVQEEFCEILGSYSAADENRSLVEYGDVLIVKQLISVGGYFCVNLQATSSRWRMFFLDCIKPQDGDSKPLGNVGDFTSLHGDISQRHESSIRYLTASEQFILRETLGKKRRFINNYTGTHAHHFVCCLFYYSCCSKRP